MKVVFQYNRYAEHGSPFTLLKPDVRGLCKTETPLWIREGDGVKGGLLMLNVIQTDPDNTF